MRGGGIFIFSLEWLVSEVRYNYYFLCIIYSRIGCQQLINVAGSVLDLSIIFPHQGMLSKKMSPNKNGS